MADDNIIDGTPPEKQTEEKVVEFVGPSGVHHIPEKVYNDMMTRFRGEKSSLENKFQKQLEEITNKYSTLETNFKEIQKSSLSETERLEIERKEKEEALLQAQAESESNLQKYKNFRIKSEIQSIVNKYADKLVSPQHVAILLETVLKPDLKDEKVFVDGKTLEDAFKEYISLEENKSLLRNNLMGGAGTFINNQGRLDSDNEKFDINKTKGMSQAEINEYMDKFS